MKLKILVGILFTLIECDIYKDFINMPDITDTEISDQYRFSGYNLPMLQLDSTGPAYYYIPEPHPYYINQPAYYQKTEGLIGAGAPVVVDTTVAPADQNPQIQMTKSSLYPLGQP